MKNIGRTEIEHITRFIEDEIEKHQISYDWEIEDNYLTATFNGEYTNNKDLELIFSGFDGYLEIEIDWLTHKHCDTKTFWIEFNKRVTK